MRRETTPAQVAPGETVEFVRWVHTADGWRPETVTGVYRGRDSARWRVVVGGSPLNLDRSEWELCRR